MHVSPFTGQKGFMMLFNPTKEVMTKIIKLPLYYTGLTQKVKITDPNGLSNQYNLNRDYSIDFTFTIPPDTYKWFVIE
jgi:hypothetical protein